MWGEGRERVPWPGCLGFQKSRAGGRPTSLGHQEGQEVLSLRFRFGGRESKLCFRDLLAPGTGDGSAPQNVPLLLACGHVHLPGSAPSSPPPRILQGGLPLGSTRLPDSWAVSGPLGSSRLVHTTKPCGDGHLDKNRVSREAFLTLL